MGCHPSGDSSVRHVPAGAVLFRWKACKDFEESDGQQWLVLKPDDWNAHKPYGWRLDVSATVEAEKARLEGQLEKITKEIDKAGAKLNNPKFTERAPEDVLQEAKDRLADWQEKERQTRESIEYLSEA